MSQQPQPITFSMFLSDHSAQTLADWLLKHDWIEVRIEPEIHSDMVEISVTFTDIERWGDYILTGLMCMAKAEAEEK